ncbi:glycosyltransferase family 39 protein [Candidatus Shapirobacteria bacterium]|nr:glycosyltransferase family 39 protein [Candidatus Shapirobacteria bacterium]
MAKEKIFKKPAFWLGLILILAAFLRFYKIGQVPPSLNWDEVAIGYNAYSILETGKDEWGVPFPLLGFESFGEYKLPLFIYATIPVVAIFGLNEVGVRFAPALFGVVGVWAAYLLAKEIFKKEKIALLTAFILAVDIWHLQITRVAFEAGLAQLLICFSILFLLKSEKKWFFLPLSFLMACLSVYTYNSSRTFIPLFFAFAFLLNRRLFLKNKKGLFLGALIILLFAVPLLLNYHQPVVQGRYQLISIQDDPGFVLTINQKRGELLERGWPQSFARLAHNKATHYVWNFGKYYFSHFTPSFLFISGAEHTQQSVPGLGQFLWFWAPFLLWGVIITLKKAIREKNFPSQLLLLQISISPVGTAMTINANPHALRTFCGLPAWQIMIALGATEAITLIKKIKKPLLQYIILAGMTILFLANFVFYLHQYYLVYPKEYAHDWQYGYKEAVSYVWENREQYDKVFFTRDYGEPYIFFLFYTKYPPQAYQQAIKERVKRHNWVLIDRIEKFYFPDFSDPGNSVLEIAKKEKGRLLFVGSAGDLPQEGIKKTIKFPNGKIAFEIGETPEQ